MTHKKTRVTNVTISRQQKLRDEIVTILHEESRRSFDFMASRENTLQKRLNAIEEAGIPVGVLEEIKQDISSLRYSIRQQTKAIESLLAFFNTTKGFLNMDDEKKK